MTDSPVAADGLEADVVDTAEVEGDTVAGVVAGVLGVRDAVFGAATAAAAGIEVFAVTEGFGITVAFEGTESFGLAAAAPGFAMDGVMFGLMAKRDLRAGRGASFACCGGGTTGAGVPEEVSDWA